jgi:hypothetical protein
MTKSSLHGGSQNAPLSIEAFLNAATDAVIDQRTIPAAWSEHYDVTPSEAASWLALIRGLSAALVLVKPSKSFSGHLKSELIGRDRTMVERVRQLPPRVQIAATLAVAAGLWLLARRRYAALAAAVEMVSDDANAEVGVLAQ